MKKVMGCKEGRAFLIESHQTALACHSLNFFFFLIDLKVRKGVGNEKPTVWLGLEPPAPKITSSKGRDISSGQRDMKTQQREMIIVPGPDLTSFYTWWEKPCPPMGLQPG